MKKKQGFTLIELLVVISIIALLSSIVLASLNLAKTRAQASAIRQNFYQLQTALLLYQEAHGGKVIEEPVFSGNAFDEPFHGVEAGSIYDVNDFYTTLSPLVDDGSGGHYIPQIAKNPVNAANNGLDFRFIYWTECPAYWTKQYNDSYNACGTKPFGSYALMVYDPGNKYGSKLNMDNWTVYSGWNNITKSYENAEVKSGYYCVTNNEN